MFILTSWRLPLQMRQPGMVEERFLEDLLFQFYIHFISRECLCLFKELRLPLSCDWHLQWQERSLLGLVFFQVFRPSPCMTLLHVLVMGFGPRLPDFSFFKAPHYAFGTLGCCLLFGYFGPVFFLLLFPGYMFVHWLFIYLFFRPSMTLGKACSLQLCSRTTRVAAQLKSLLADNL